MLYYCPMEPHCPLWSQPARTPNREDNLGAEGFPPGKPEQPQWQEGFGRSHLICRQGAL